MSAIGYQRARRVEDRPWMLAPEHDYGRFTVAGCEFWQAFDALRDVDRSISGTGSGCNVTAPWDATALGVVRCNTGTTTTGRAAFQSNTSAMLLGGAEYAYAARIRLFSGLSDDTNTFILYSGIADSTSAEPTDGVYFRYSHSVGNWELVQRNNGSEIATDTGLAVANQTPYVLRIEIAADASSCVGYVNGTKIVPASFGLPTASGRNTGIVPVNIRKTAGTSARSVDIDYFTLTARFLTPTR